MARFWVHIHEKHAHHITVDAPSMEAAKKWASEHGSDFVYETARESDETVSIGFDAIEKMSLADEKRFKDDVEVWVGEDGKEKEDAEEKEDAAEKEDQAN